MILAALALTAVQTRVELESFYALYEHGDLGLNGCVVLDSNPVPRIFLVSPGDREFVNSPLEYYYLELQWDAGSQAFAAKYVSPIWDEPIMAMGAGDVLGIGRPQLVIRRHDDQVDVVDPDTHAVLSSFNLHLSTFGGYAVVADSDLDGVDEIHLSTPNNTVYVVDGSGNVEWVFDTGYQHGRTLAIGQMDADPSLEIATTGGMVWDVASRSLQWSSIPLLRGYAIASGDLDGDGMEELVAVSSYGMQAFDVETKRSKWLVSNGGFSTSKGELILTDLEPDGVLEILNVSSSNYGLRCFEGLTGQVRWNLTPPYDGANRVRVADFDADGEREIFHIPGDGFPPRLTNALTLANEWTATNVHAPFVGPELGDLEGDGRNELVLAALDYHTQPAHSNRGRIHVLDPRDYRPLAASPKILLGRSFTAAIQDISLRDLDGNGKLEIVIATGNARQPSDEAGDLRIYDYLPDRREVRLRWQSMSQHESYHSVDAADLRLDGLPELIAGREIRDGLGTHLCYFSIRTGTKIALTADFGPPDSRVDELVAEDFDADGAPEVLCLVAGSGLYLFEAFSLAPDSVAAGPYTCLEVDASFMPPRILAGTEAGEIVELTYSAAGLQVLATRTMGVGALTGFVETPAGGIWLGAEGRLWLWDPASGATVWSSQDYGSKTGRWMAWDAARPRSILTQANNGLFRFLIR